MPDRVVRLIITGENATAIKAIEGTEVAADKFATKSKALGSSLKGAGHTAVALAVPLVALGAVAVKTSADFQTAMTQIHTQTGASAAEVSRMSGAINRLAPNVGEGPTQLAEALYPIESVGLRGTSAIKALTAASEGAQVSQSGLTETADAMSGALRTQMKDITSASGAMSIMNGIVGIGKMHLADLTEAMSTGILPQAKQVGLGFRDIGAALAAMTRQGIPASVEATRLRTNLTQMVAPSGAALKALQSIGLQQFSLANAMRQPNGLVTALSLLRSHLQGLSKDQQSLILSEAFGKSKGSSNVMGLLNALPEMTSMRSQLNGFNEKQLSSAFLERSKNAAFQFQKAIAGAKVALEELGTRLTPIVVPALMKVGNIVMIVVKGLSHLPKPVLEGLAAFTALLAVAGPILIFAGSIANAVGIISAAMGVLDLSMAFNPVILIMAALVGMTILVATHFKTVASAVEVAFNAVGSVVKGVFVAIANTVIGGINLIIKAIDLLIKGYDDIPSFLRPTGAIGQIGQIGDLDAHHALIHHGGSSHPGDGGGRLEVHHQPIHTQIFLDRHAKRPLAEAVTEYQLSMAARK